MEKSIVIGTFDAQLFEHLRGKLAQADVHIRLVQRGEKILLEILDNDIDLLILDLDLAGAMGIDMLPVIRRLRPRLPMILITEDMNARIRKTAAEVGLIYQAFKPMTNAETDAIATATARFINRRREVALS